MAEKNPGKLDPVPPSTVSEESGARPKSSSTNRTTGVMQDALNRAVQRLSHKNTSDNEGVSPLKDERFCIQVVAQYEDEGDTTIPLNLWRPDILRDLLSPAYEGLTEAVAPAHLQAVLFYGRRTANEGLTRSQAEHCVQRIPKHIRWLETGPRLYLHTGIIRVQAGRALISSALADYKRRRGRPSRKSVSPETPFRLARKPWGLSPASADNEGLWEFDLERTSSPEGSPRVPRSNLTNTSRGRPSRRSLDRPSTGRDTGVQTSSGSGAEGGSETDASYQSAASHETTASRRRHRRRRERESRDRREMAPRAKVLISTYNGESSAGSTTYAAWRHDVEEQRALFRDDRRLRTHVVASLQGPPGELVRNMPPGTTLEELLAKLDRFYGDVQSFDQLHREMLAMSLKGQEKVNQYAVRVNNMANRIITLFPTRVTPEAMEATKRDQLYYGLNSEYQSRLQYLVDRRHACTFEELLLAARELEKHVEVNNNKPRQSTTSTVHKPTATTGFANGSFFANRRLKGHTQPVKKATIEKGSETEAEETSGSEEDNPCEEILTTLMQTLGTKRCFGCQSTEHFLRDCPERGKGDTRKDKKSGNAKGDSTKGARNPPNKKSNATSEKPAVEA